MKRFLMAALLGVMLLGGASASHAQVSLGIRIGPPPAPRVIRVRPRAPGPDYTWIDGYWYASGSRYLWHAGYWTRPPYEGARWVGPRYEGNQFYAGYWDGDRGRVDHDHQWDKDHKNRDYGHNDHHDDHH